MDQAGRARHPAHPRGVPEVAIIRLDEVTSTQDEAARRLQSGQRTPFALTARHQSRGRGRLGRPFASQAGGSLALTYVHRSRLDPARRGWFPLAAGLAALTALDAVLGPGATGSRATGPGTTGPDSTGPDATSPGSMGTDITGAARIGLKWPNDLHTEDGRKLGGILVEGRGADVVMLGIGLNLRGPILQADGTELPGAAWLRGDHGLRPGAATGTGPAGGAEPGRAAHEERTAREDAGALGARLESALAAALAEELALLESTGGDGVGAGTHERYTMTCLTLGRAVRVDPLGERGAGGEHPPSLHGTARAIDARGRLVVDLGGGEQVAVDVGDVRHLRPGDPVRSTTRDATGIEQEEHGT